MMKNYSNVTANPYLVESITHVVIFEVAVVLGAIVIIVSSGLVLRHIYGKVRRSRADLLLIVLSISDIGVGSLSQTSLGLYAIWLHIKFNVTREFRYAAAFLLYFPYIFSYVVTTIVALDTLFVVTKQHSYTNFITKRRLMYILAFFFATTIGLCNWLIYTAQHTRAGFHEPYTIYIAFNIALSIIIIGAYILILCFAYSHSRAASHCKNNGSSDFKRLTKTIMFIFAFQVICNLPFQIGEVCNILLPLPWLLILRNTSSLFNGIILLLSERKKKKIKVRVSEETNCLKNLVKFPST